LLYGKNARSPAACCPATDSIHLPLKEQFPSAGDYYSTLLHELGHWTGHPARLNRNLSDPFGSIGYAREELRAEIASMIIGSELGIGYDPGQHAAYAASWIQMLDGQPMEIFRAAADGEKIHTYLQSFQQQQSLPAEALQAAKSEIIKEYDRLVDGPAARERLEKERPSLVAARDKAVVELRRENSRKKLLKSHTRSPGCAGRCFLSGVANCAIQSSLRGQINQTSYNAEVHQ
jgi:hypothetical protein